MAEFVFPEDVTVASVYGQRLQFKAGEHTYVPDVCVPEVAAAIGGVGELVKVEPAPAEPAPAEPAPAEPAPAEPTPVAEQPVPEPVPEPAPTPFAD